MHATWLKNHLSTCRLGNKTPYEVLYNKKPNLEKLPVWGCHVKVHNMTGSKLDMHARDSHWVSFDPESDGHRIYFADRGNVGIEQSVIFACRDEMVTLMSVNAQPVGEREHSPNSSNGEPNVDIADANAPSNEPVHSAQRQQKMYLATLEMALNIHCQNPYSIDPRGNVSNLSISNT